MFTKSPLPDGLRCHTEPGRMAQGSGVPQGGGIVDKSVRRAAIEAWPLPDGPDGADFATRLCAATGWDRGFAEGANGEYRRFAALCALEAGTRRVPSDPVAVVWGLHRAAAAEYARFCAEAVGRYLAPDKSGGRARRAKEARATRSAYFQEFGHLPPERFWPSPQRRLRRHLAIALALAGAVAGLWTLALLPAIAGAAIGVAIWPPNRPATGRVGPGAFGIGAGDAGGGN